MNGPTTPILEYAHPALGRRRLRDLPGILAVPAALGMTAASFFTMLYAAVEEPFYNWTADPIDVLVCWVMPVLIALGWVAWGVLTFRRTRQRPRPRWATALTLILSLPAFAWSMLFIYEGNRGYRLDRATVAEWQRLAAAEAAAATTTATAPATPP